MSQEPFTISASFAVDETGLAHRITVQHTGRVELVEESNADEPSNNTIGVYSINIGPKRAQDFRDMWAALSSRPLPKSGPVPPGTTMVRVTLDEHNQQQTWLIDPSTSPPAMCKAAERIRDFAKEVRKSPVRELQLTAKLDRTVVDPSTPLGLSVGLSARGTETVRIIDPLKAPQTGAGGFTLWGVRSDLPPAELWPRHSKHQVLTRRESTQSPPPTPDEFLVLEPNRTTEYNFTVPVGWEPGEYSVKIIFETLTNAGGALNGKIISAPVNIRVQ